MPSRRAVTGWVLVAGVAGANAVAGCNASIDGVVFGTYDPFRTTASDTAGDMAVQCDSATQYQLTLSTGFGGYAGRRMPGSSGGALRYNLFVDSARSLVWGDGSAGSVPVAGNSGAGKAVHHVVYGRIPARQNAPAGSYSDSVTLTISY